MDRASLYDEAYNSFLTTPLAELRGAVERDSKRMLLWVTENKDRFIPARSWRELRVLECGGGLGGLSLQLAERGARCTLIDVSGKALELAQSLAQGKGVELEVHKQDVGMPSDLGVSKFDIIVDSHLLHCLPTAPERASYHQFVKDHLAPNGIVVGETMAHRKKIFVPEGWRMDEDHVLWQKFGDWLPVRKVSDSLDLETEFKAAGFSIACFLYYANYGIAPSAAYWDIPADILPAAVRYVLKRD